MWEVPSLSVRRSAGAHLQRVGLVAGGAAQPQVVGRQHQHVLAVHLRGGEGWTTPNLKFTIRTVIAVFTY